MPDQKENCSLYDTAGPLLSYKNEDISGTQYGLGRLIRRALLSSPNSIKSIMKHPMLNNLNAEDFKRLQEVLLRQQLLNNMPRRGQML